MREGLVFDIETKANPNLRKWLGVDEQIARLEGKSLAQLQGVARANGFNLNENFKEEAALRYLEKAFSKEIVSGAVKPYGCVINTIACRPIRGVLRDLADYEDNQSAPEVWPGTVFQVTDRTSEEDVVRGFLDYLDSFDEFPILMGFNIRGSGKWGDGFDIPILRIRTVALRLRWPRGLPRVVSEDRGNKLLWDIRDVLTEGNCDRWLRVFELPTKTDSGSNVQHMTPGESALYCANDVDLERFLAGLVIDSTQNDSLRDLLYD